MSLISSLFLFEINCKYIFFTMTGVAVGSGWQAWFAYINLGCYYVVGLPLGLLMGLVFDLGVLVSVVTSFISLQFSRDYDIYLIRLWLCGHLYVIVGSASAWPLMNRVKSKTKFRTKKIKKSQEQNKDSYL